MHHIHQSVISHIRGVQLVKTQCLFVIFIKNVSIKQADGHFWHFSVSMSFFKCLQGSNETKRNKLDEEWGGGCTPPTPQQGNTLHCVLLLCGERLTLRAV